MLPVSSATSCGSSYAKVPIHGGLKSQSLFLNSFDYSCNNVDKAVSNFLNGSHLNRGSIKTRPVSCCYSNIVGDCEKYEAVSTSSQSLYQNGVGNMKQLIQSGYQVGVDPSHSLGPNGIIYVDSSTNAAGDDRVMDFISKTVASADSQPNYSDPESLMTFDMLPVDPPLVSDPLDTDVNSFSDQKANFDDVVSKMNGSVADTIKGGEKALNDLVDTVTSSVTTSLANAKEAIDNVYNDIISFINKSGESAGNKLTGLGSGVKETSGKAGFVALDVLRGTVVVIEDSLIQGAKTVGYAYGSAKEFLPPDLQAALSLSEESVVKVLNPVGAVFQQVYIAVEGFEQSLGLDPNDPLVSVALFLGVSATLWGSYRVLNYGGYAGDLSPQSTFELLRGKERVALVDIRPESLREKDGIPDLRRAARSRCASITIPEVDASVKKLLKGGRDVEDSLLATVICNLKIVERRSKVVIMDADGSRSKGVARSLRKLGIERPYLVQGGFRSWVKEGIRAKALKPETALTVLNEEAEAILEEIKPTPLKLAGYGLVLAAAAYSVLEWEKTLQFIGIIGLGQTVYQRVASYQDADEFKQDVRLLLAPVKRGSEAFQWVTGKLETNINGLPTSPSSSDVQSRVLQAAAKHESQPSDTEEPQDSSQRASSGGDNVKVSEA